MQVLLAAWLAAAVAPSASAPGDGSPTSPHPRIGPAVAAAGAGWSRSSTTT